MQILCIGRILETYLEKKSLLIRALSTDPYWKEIGVSNFPSIIFQMDSAGSVNKQLTIMQLFVYKLRAFFYYFLDMFLFSVVCVRLFLLPLTLIMNKKLSGLVVSGREA